jgi:transcriptional regulator with XRE-family HTH domain
MTAGNDPSHKYDSRQNLETGAELYAWRTRMGISARELGKLIGVTARSIHRAEQSAKLGTKVKLAMELFRSRLVHREIDLSSSVGAPSRRGRPPKCEPMVVGEDEAQYGTHWHGELRTGADLRSWRKSIGLYQQELAGLLNVTPHTLRRAEQSDSPSSGVIYGAELLRTKVISGAFDLGHVKKLRRNRGRPKKT